MNSFLRHFSPICKGAGIGLLFGLASIATADKKLLSFLEIANKPVGFFLWLCQKMLGWSDGTTALTGWLLLGIYWMIIGGLIGWGYGVARSQGSPDE